MSYVFHIVLRRKWAKHDSLKVSPEAFSLFEDRDFAMAKAFIEVLRETHPENIPDWLWDAANQRLFGELRFTCPDACTAAIKASPHR